MPIEHLALVTQAIKTTVEAAFAPNTVTTTAASPLDVTGPVGGTDAKSVVSVFLFHIVEDAHLKNQANSRDLGISAVPIRQIPLALNLYYVINAHNFSNDIPNDQAVAVQNLLGVVAKTLHDNPVLTINDPDVVTPGGNRVEIILRPVTIDEAVQFWASDETHLIRPSIYIEARVVFIQPDKPQTIPGVVLSVNSPAIVGLGPQLISSSSALVFEVPKFGQRKLAAEPARVALFDPNDVTIPAAQQENNRVTIKGSSLGAGPALLELSRNGKAVQLDLLNPQPSPIPAWVAASGSSAVTLKLWTTIFDSTAARHTSTPLFPGTYTARFIDNSLSIARSSNEIAFSVVPQVKSVTLNAPASDTYTLLISGTYIADVSGNVDIQLVVGKEVLEPATSGPGLGQYMVGTVNIDGVQYGSITFRRTSTPTEVVNGDHPLPVNLLVNGASGTPVWITEK